MKIDGVTFNNVTISSCPHGEVVFTTPGTYSWVAPAGVTSVSVVCVGAGGAGGSNGGKGGGGGALGYKNNIAVSPGSNYTVVVGQGGGNAGSFGGGGSGTDSYFISAVTVLGGGGSEGDAVGGSIGGSFVGDLGGQGGSGGPGIYTYVGGGGGGAGGYGGIGGSGGAGGYTGQAQAIGTNGSPGIGGAGGGGAGQNQINNLSPPTGGGGSGLWGNIVGNPDGGAGGRIGSISTTPATPGLGGSGGNDGRAGAGARSANNTRNYWVTTTGTISGTTLTFGPTEGGGDSIANFGTNFLGMKVLYVSSPADLYIVASISGTGVNSQWRLNKVPSPLPTGTEEILVLDGPNGGSPGGGGGGSDGNTSVAGRGGDGAVRIIWPGDTRSFPNTNAGRVLDYGFDIVRPVEFYVNATDPASYTSGSTALNDVSGNNINGTVTAGTTLSGPGITFNGSSQTANFGNVLPSIAGNAFSFGCWVKFNNVTTAQTVMGKQSATDGKWTFGIQTTGYIIANIGVNGFQPTSGSGFFGAYLWTHVTITFSSTGTISIYFNGSQVAISNFAAPVTSSTGSVYVGSAGASGYLNGVVGEAFFYRKALTAAEVLQNYTNTKWKYGL